MVEPSITPASASVPALSVIGLVTNRPFVAIDSVAPASLSVTLFGLSTDPITTV